ncbi:hypothetical protein wVul_0950 [Wolbachia endosymbiont of Armadillidium vulgare str. wVulC]|uniref:Uncharacterized protein n=1 Tax=Wolbachia endosymbiont of Armadillidium arcangelii TaxID=3158571 RepID=A0AAU7Q396_9RICK|nr:hypothetical protein [Wolbachia endosymbiont of Armadillidium vulgare]KLT22585.1 hypothetical protein wVul_0950 [Wolbachia endosymbiont of Armadillidium vulgare str. wVulC]OJH31741.1 hypothetical protein Wxf_01144 [Wolbachia endosymbiont of Armadillidium vulgare]OJH32741.1 hypothetical protein Wxf_02193 [Wolbachia endosymbiont of Armadillidium vulgare]OJH33363.1 hypothetical protein Wxf_02847 [Wolbachia endosymbiont of Armadillidium vulgare]
MVESIRKQDKKLDTNNIKEGFYEYKESSYRTQWKIAFEQSQYLEQNKNKPRAQLLNLNIETTSCNKRII